MTNVLPPPGTMLTPLFESVDIWGEEGFNSLDKMKPGEIITIVDDVKWDEKQSYRLNSNLYVHVLSPRGVVGWVHIDNVKVLD